MNRRSFIQTSTKATAAFVLAANILNAEEGEEGAPKNPMLQRIDTTLMGPKGEITAGFLLTLNPRPCAHFSDEQKKSKSTDPLLIRKIYRDLVLHGNKPDHIRAAITEAKTLWLKEQSQDAKPAEPTPTAE